MTAPSLVVIFVGGWGAADPGKNNLFYQQSFAFLDQFVSSYPTIALEPTKKGVGLSEVYKTFGSVLEKGDQFKSLSQILSDHNINQLCLADAYRYGLLTEKMHGDAIEPLENEEWEYLSLPPLKSASEAPETSLPVLAGKFDRIIKKTSNQVTFISLGGIWAMAQFKQIAPVNEAIKETHALLTKLMQKLLDGGIRILVVSDSGLAEEYFDLETSTIDAKVTNNPLPCILLDQALEGKSAGQEDFSNTGQISTIPSGTIADIAPTILSLMHIPKPEGMAGSPLFLDCIKSL